MHIHLDLTGGIAGDMFSAALLDARPDLENPLLNMLKKLQLGTEVLVSTCHASDKGLTGKRFNVDLIESIQKKEIDSLQNSSRHHNHGHEHNHHEHEHNHHEHEHNHHEHEHNHHEHGHSHHEHEHSHHEHEHSHHEHHNWQQIRQFITESNLDNNVKANAIGIFGLLAVAEAKVHNMDVDTVQFHEVGAWDCIVDIISASWLIEHSGAKSWSVSSLPWGGGTINCAHGNIPVPAPATLNLLKGFEFIDDGIKGERITPTGAAIIAWISPSKTVATGSLKDVGYGFGTRKLQGRANVLRASLIETGSVSQVEQIAVIQCDIDDMTNEMLAIAREKIRDLPQVLEITEAMVHGKKNRFISTLTILCQPSCVQVVTDAVLNNTSTLGVRYWHCNRISLNRLHHQITYNKQQFDVKSVRRPDNSITSKLEADHLASTETNYQQRNQLKRNIEQQAEVEQHEHNT